MCQCWGCVQGTEAEHSHTTKQPTWNQVLACSRQGIWRNSFSSSLHRCSQLLCVLLFAPFLPHVQGWLFALFSLVHASEIVEGWISLLEWVFSEDVSLLYHLHQRAPFVFLQFDFPKTLRRFPLIFSAYCPYTVYRLICSYV